MLPEINNHNLVKNARRKFDTLFKELIKMKQEADSPEYQEFIFLLETQLITLYFQRIMHNLEIISSTHQNLISFRNKREHYEFALQRLNIVLSNYDHQQIAKLLKCTSLTANENK